MNVLNYFKDIFLRFAFSQKVNNDTIKTRYIRDGTKKTLFK